MGFDIKSHNRKDKHDDKDKHRNRKKFIITYRPNTHNGVARPKLKNGKDTRQITRRAQWTDKCRIVRIRSVIKLDILLIMILTSKVIDARLVKSG